MTDTDSQPQRFVAIRKFTFVVAALAALTVLYYANPAADSHFPACPLHNFTGLHCPGCGTLRAIHCLVHGHLLAAFRLNPLMLLSLPLIAWLKLEQASYSGRIPGNLRISVPGKIIHSLPWIVIAYFVLRNLPLFPFNLLAPS